MIIGMPQPLNDLQFWQDVKALAVKYHLTLDIRDGKAVLEPPAGCASSACDRYQSGSYAADTAMVSSFHVRWFCSPACITPGMEAHYEHLHRHPLEP